MKKGTLFVSVIIPVTLIGLTLIALILINEAHAIQFLRTGP